METAKIPSGDLRRSSDADAASEKGPFVVWEVALRTANSRSFTTILILVALCVPLACCSEGVLDPRGPVGAAERVILYNATAIMLAVVIPVIVLTLAFAWWFRAGNHRAQYLPNWQYSGAIEMIVWSIPALVVLFLGGMAWTSSHDLDPPKALGPGAPLEIQVVSTDWKWLFIYPAAEVAMVNRVVVPAGKPVRFHLTSATVMNSFFVPQLGSQIYTMAGMTNHLNLQADEPGTYKGFSSQFSGEGFSDMRFELVAVPANEFDGWIAKVKSSGTTLDAARLSQLLKPSVADEPALFKSVDPDLFDAIAAGHAAHLSSNGER
jgi:cytochrome o ubiquinol oxidase subunit 2